MKKSIKKGSVALAIVMLNSVLIPVNSFAMSYDSVINKEIANELSPNDLVNKDSYSSEDFYNQLKDLGFTNEEMLDLYQKEADKLGIELKLPEKLYEFSNINSVKPVLNSRYTALREFPSNPRKKQSYTAVCTVDFNEICKYLGYSGATGAVWIVGHCTKQQVAKAIIATNGFMWVTAATALAGAVFTALAQSHNGFKAKVTWHYTENNDGYLDWVQGVTTFSWY